MGRMMTASITKPAVRSAASERSSPKAVVRYVGKQPDEAVAAAAGMTGAELTSMYRLLGVAKYGDRYVIPTAYEAEGRQLEEVGCSLDYEGGPGMYESGPFGEASGRPMPVSVETFHALKQRQTSEGIADPETRGARVNLLNWDGKGTPPGLFPPRPGEQTGDQR
jgi:nitrate reductase / nitrite oxidoreductase, beta subunit